MPWPESAYHPEDFAQPGGSAKILATLHPSAILRADNRETAYQGFVADLRVAASVLAPRGQPADRGRAPANCQPPATRQPCT